METRKGGCAVLHRGTREREHMGRKEVGCNYHLLLPAAALDLSFRLSCLISTSALRHRFLAACGLGN